MKRDAYTKLYHAPIRSGKKTMLSQRPSAIEDLLSNDSRTDLTREQLVGILVDCPPWRPHDEPSSITTALEF